MYGLNPQSDPVLELFGDTLHLNITPSLLIPFDAAPSQESVQAFYNAMDAADWQPVVNALIRFREAHRLDDWFYYQLIRKTAQKIAPKAENYHRYTLYKWFFLCKSGYDATLAVENDQLKFYVRSEENVYNIPY